mgnify:CR=1 FL=1
MVKEKLTKSLGKRILSEANDLKRTASALANDIDIDEKYMKQIINGECELADSYKIIKKMGSFYPIDISDLYLLEDDCENAVRIMRAEESANSSRIFSRLNKSKIKTPYYEYRDTAMSCIAPYKPEWIKELRNVDNNDPNNPDVAYNNGHFMHQTTFFVGPVNFYWEVNGEKFCRKMNTGDSNYITGQIPECIGDLINLNYLNLGWNQLYGELPESIGNLTDLTFLNILSNQLSGEISESISNFINLKEGSAKVSIDF